MGCCGLDWAECPTYIATQNDDDVARAEAATYVSEKIGVALRPEQMNCDGCLTEGSMRFRYCQTCEIRMCCVEKALDNCSLCSEQPCEILAKFHEMSPIAKANFDELLKESGST